MYLLLRAAGKSENPGVPVVMWGHNLPHRLRYHKVASFNMSRLEADAGFFRLFMKGIFSPYVHCAVTFWQKADFLISNTLYNSRLYSKFNWFAKIWGTTSL